MALQVTEIHPCILGESTLAGRPCTLVRLTGCPLRCRYCDTEYAFHGGTRQTVESVVARVAALGLPLVLLTGGEPLAQKDAPELIRRLLGTGRQVTVETSGAIDISRIPDGAHTVLDVKCPDSGESHRMNAANLERLRPGDDVKFVIVSERDYRFARRTILEHALGERANVLISPAHGEIEPSEIAGWMIEDRLPARLHLQIHKVVWSPDMRGV